MAEHEATCLGVVPIQAGVMAIGVFQMTYEGLTVGFYIQHGLEDESYRFYVDFTLHCLNVLSAILLIAGVGTKTRQMLCPWLLLTVMVPTMFLLNLLTSLFFLKFQLAGDLIVHDALVSLIAFYLCSVVYNLYNILEYKENTSDVFGCDSSGTVYGTEGVIYTNETVASNREAPPPSYSTIVAAHKEHVHN